MLLLCLVFYAINKHILNIEFEHLHLETFRKHSKPVLFGLAFLLMPLNWFLESIKWRAIVNLKSVLSIRDALKSILCGTTLSIVTPARLGDHLGRMMLIRKDDRGHAFYASFLCSIAQNAVGFIIGLCGLLLFFNHEELKDIDFEWLIAGGAFFSLLILIAYFNNGRILDLLNKNNRVRKFLNFSNAERADGILLLSVLFISMLRYAVYVCQFTLVCYALGVQAEVFNLVSAICVIYLIQSLLPIPSIFDVVTRAEIALVVLNQFIINEWLIVLSSGLLWIINLIIPALLGLVLVFKIKS